MTQQDEVISLRAEVSRLRAERDQWQQRAEGAVYALMLTEPHMLAGNMTEWIANCAQALEAQGKRLAELERAVVWAPVEHEFSFGTLQTWDDAIEDGDGVDDWWIRINEIAAPLDEYRLCRRITQEGVDDGTQNDAH